MNITAKKFFVGAAFVSSTTIAVAGDPYYLISRGFADGSVIAVYGWADNKTPCHSLEKHMNETMKLEGNYHRFSCVNGDAAMAIDCGSGKEERLKCTASWRARNDLLRQLNRD